MHDPQLEAFRIYTHLRSLRTDWGGQLILNTQLDEDGQALAFAAIAVGAACLTIEPDVDLCRAATRNNSVDFLVNTVDEALRVLKNEIRKHTPLSVALQLAPDAALLEMEQRGVYPALLAGQSRRYPAAALLGKIPHSDSQIFAFTTSAELRVFDQKLQQAVDPQDARFRWLNAAPRLFHRDRRRVIELTDAERATLT